MGHRPIAAGVRYGGDVGQVSSLRLEKDSPVTDALGALDELNSFIGLVISHAMRPETVEILGEVQHDLLDLITDVGMPSRTMLSSAHVRRIKRWCDELNDDLDVSMAIVLPGGTIAASEAHVARAICHRAERCLVALVNLEAQAPPIGLTSRAELPRWGLAYLDRLSGLLFVIARHENKTANRADVLWQPKRSVDSRE
jgi:cob(I)alamin adenosyltransferase